MGYFDKLAELGFMVVCRRNQLGTTTMFAVRQDDIPLEDGWDVTYRTGQPVLSMDDMLTGLPEWRLVDFVGDDAAKGAKMLYEKLTCTGDYAKWDERLGGFMGTDDDSLLIGFEHRPESERFTAVDA